MSADKNRVRWALPVLKVLPGARLVARLGGERWFYFGSHWAEKLFLCPGERCEGCVYGAPRVMGYRVGVVETPTRLQPVLLEAPLGAIARFENLCELEGVRAVAGVRLSLTRKHRRSAVCMEPELVAAGAVALALSDVHTLNAVALLFALPELKEGEEPANWSERVRSVAHARIAAAVAKAR